MWNQHEHYTQSAPLDHYTTASFIDIVHKPVMIGFRFPDHYSGALLGTHTAITDIVLGQHNHSAYSHGVFNLAQVHYTQCHLEATVPKEVGDNGKQYISNEVWPIIRPNRFAKIV